MKTIKSEPAYAWECAFGLCRWAKPTLFDLIGDNKEPPSPEAKAVRVRIIKQSDYKLLLEAAMKGGVLHG